jgi:ribosomal protein L11 methyltransferase
MWILELTVPSSEVDFVVAELAGLGTLGLQELARPGEPVTLQAYFDTAFDPGWFAAFSPHWIRPPDVNWAEEWKRGLDPVEIGERLFLVPDWREDPTPPGRLRLTVHVAQASGSGYHPPTQLALRAIEKVLRVGETFIDVGTGSGILSRAAWLLGAGSVIACDVDWEALQEARDQIVFCGSARALQPGVAGCLAANINAQGLLLMADDLRRVVAPGGTLILSGFKERHVNPLIEAFSWPLKEHLVEAPWHCLVLAAPGQASK